MSYIYIAIQYAFQIEYLIKNQPNVKYGPYYKKHIDSYSALANRLRFKLWAIVGKNKPKKHERYRVK